MFGYRFNTYFSREKKFIGSPETFIVPYSYFPFTYFFTFLTFSFFTPSNLPRALYYHTHTHTHTNTHKPSLSQTHIHRETLKTLSTNLYYTTSANLSALLIRRNKKSLFFPNKFNILAVLSVNKNWGNPKEKRFEDILENLGFLLLVALFFTTFLRKHQILVCPR